jgi:hypothetical protein
MPPRAQKRKAVPAEPTPADNPEPKSKRNTRNSAASAGDAWLASRSGAVTNPVTVGDDNDSDFDELSDVPVQISQLLPQSQEQSQESQESQESQHPIHQPENPNSEQYFDPKMGIAPFNFAGTVNPAQPTSPKITTAQSSPIYPAGRTFTPYNAHNLGSSVTPPRMSVSPSTSGSSVSSRASGQTASPFITGMTEGFIAHPDLCEDVASAMAMATGDPGSQRQNIRGTLNHHLKLMMLVKRNITTAERKALVQHLVVKVGLNPNEVTSFHKHLDNVSSFL